MEINKIFVLTMSLGSYIKKFKVNCKIWPEIWSHFNFVP